MQKNQRIRQEQSNKRKAPEEKRFVRTVVGGGLFVIAFCLFAWRRFKDKKRTEL